MNWRRGLFRLWIVGTVLFLLAITVLSYSEIKQQFEEIALHNYIEARREVVVPQLCGNARGVAGTDYATQLRKEGPGPWDTYAKPNFFENCWYVMSKFRPLYPEYKNMSDKELSLKLYADHGIPIHDLVNPWMTLGTWASFAVGIPLVILIVGASLAWAFSGFSAKQP